MPSDFFQRKSPVLHTAVKIPQTYVPAKLFPSPSCPRLFFRSFFCFQRIQSATDGVAEHLRPHIIVKPLFFQLVKQWLPFRQQCYHRSLWIFRHVFSSFLHMPTFRQAVIARRLTASCFIVQRKCIIVSVIHLWLPLIIEYQWYTCQDFLFPLLLGNKFILGKIGRFCSVSVGEQSV